MATPSDSTQDWTSAWPDALAFAGGLAMAWRGRWTTTDLVWSLWLSSLVVGYAMIVWTIARPGLLIARGAWREGALTVQTSSGVMIQPRAAVGVGVFAAGGSCIYWF